MENDLSETSRNFGQLLHSLPQDQRNIVRQLEKTTNKISNVEISISFNLVCLQENILPGYTNFKLYNENARHRESTHQFRKELVEQEIKEKKEAANTLKTELDALHHTWNTASVPDHLRTAINEKLATLQTQHRRKEESTVIKKLSRLYGGNIKLPRPTAGYINLSNTDLTPDQEELLNKGLNCHYQTKPRPHRKRLEIEVMLDDIHKLEKAGKVRTSPDLQPSLLSEANKSRGSHQSKTISKKHIQAAKQLRDNPTITIRRADKTNNFIILNKEEYLDKMDTILGDRTKFKRITRNPTDDIKRRLNSTISSINAVAGGVHLQKLIGDFSPGYAYGTVKTHKPGNPLRPIISQIPTVTYQVAKTINQILSPYVPCQYSISSATDFLEILRDTPDTDGQLIASLDVESLFTNVPVDTTIEYILKRVYHSNLTPPTNISENSMKTLLEICTKEAPFTCPRGHMYQQIDGVAMGSPLGVLFANFFMGTIEEELLATNRPSIYCRYIDDIFVRIKDLQELQNLRQSFILSSGLNFTFEESTNGSLPFLDVLVTANHNGFVTTVYTKPTNIGLCLNGNSECPERYLRSTINAYIRRALTHCSTWRATHIELTRITQVLVNNGYSNSSINSAINQLLTKWYQEEKPKDNTNKYIEIFYKNHMSSEYKKDEAIMRDIILKNVHPSNPDEKIKLIIYYKSMKTSHLLLRNRPAQDKSSLQQDHVIYRHTCNNVDCGPHSYIGMTRTRLTRRLTLHLQNGTIKNHYKAPFHQDLTRQDLDNNTIILDRETDHRRLAYLESIYIQTLRPTLNIQTEDFQALPTSKRATNNVAHNFIPNQNNHPAPSTEHSTSSPSIQPATIPQHTYLLRSCRSNNNHSQPITAQNTLSNQEPVFTQHQPIPAAVIMTNHQPPHQT